MGPGRRCSTLHVRMAHSPGISVLCIDITEIRRASEQLQSAYSEIEQLKQAAGAG